ncbi:hypothetical protein [Arenibacter palladensis]|uniref:hypothetical protein n=1 Tax=Arenibacter palladensis TaxID=237373 RepID=UPI0015B524D9|nr:hypothetical protein [Arenibacter palladensis]
MIAMDSSQKGTLGGTILGLGMESTTPWHIFAKGECPKKQNELQFLVNLEEGSDSLSYFLSWHNH